MRGDGVADPAGRVGGRLRRRSRGPGVGGRRVLAELRPISYNDFRNNTSDPGLSTDYRAAHCHPGTSDWSQGSVYASENRLTEASFDTEDAPFARGYFVGGYEDLVNDGADFTPFFSQPHGSDPSSVFLGRLGPP